ncbi:MAG: LCP family protein [Clostridia bacterium]|nr:LCP family protein [Clostridia bacterium]
MTKRIALIALALLLTLSCVTALAEISITRKDLNVVKGLDQNVTNVLILLQDGDQTDTIMLAGINSKTGRAVMTRLDGNMIVNVTKGGEAALKDVYMMGDKKSKGLLAVSTINSLLSLNINTYVALDINVLPELVENVGTLNMQYDAQEAAALGTWEGINHLTGEDILTYIRLRLDSDSPARSRGYDALMQLLYQGLHSGNITDMMGLGSKLLKSMDTNLNALNAVTLVSAVQGGSDRRELLLPAEEQIVTTDPLTADAEAMRALLHANLYE